MNLFLVESRHSSATDQFFYNGNLSATAFLTYNFKHLNDLNKKLKGKHKLVPELFSEVRGLREKFDLISSDRSEELLHFPN
jgi:hypothetical protein